MSEKNSGGNPTPKRRKLKPDGRRKPIVTALTVNGKDVEPLSYPGKPPAYEEKRLEALYVYVTDLDKCTLNQLHKDPRFSDIPLDTIIEWSKKDGWSKLRAETTAKIRARLQKQLEISMTETLRMELDKLEAMIGESELQMGRVAARSWEGVAKIMMSALERKDSIVQRIVAEQVDSVSDEEKVGELPEAVKAGEFNADDFREAAAYLLQKRIERSSEPPESNEGGDKDGES